MSEHGDRAAFLTRVRTRQAPAPAGGPHPPPEVPQTVPTMRYRSLDDDPDLVDVFAAVARAAEATVDVVAGEMSAESIASFVRRHDVSTAVVSREPEAEPVASVLVSSGVEIAPYDPATGAVADLAVTSATHGLATTGSVVVDSRTAGSRAVSLLPRVHLCVLPAERIVPTHADVLRGQSRPMPSCRIVLSGPSRTGDIEQLLTLGAHGPVALHVLVLT